MIAENLGYGNTSTLNHPVGSFVDKEGQQNKQVVNDAWDGLDISPETLESDSILAETARQYTGKVADELNKMIQFQLRRDTKSPVSCIYTYGSFSGIKGFSSTLSQALSCTVETIDSVSNVKIEKSVRIGKYINAIGALIRL